MPPPERPTTRSGIPFEIEAFRTRPRRGRRALWALLACLAAGVTAWALFQPAPESPAPPTASASQALPPGPPWLLGSPDARYTLTLYADLECPFCRSYVPTLTAWVEQHPEIRHDVQVPDRKGNWVQKYVNPDDALLYASSQFFRYQEAERFVAEHLSDPQTVARKLKERRQP